MFPLANQLELRKVAISSLVTCIYLPIIITFISYKGLLYSVGNGSSFYILALIFYAEFLKSFYLNSSFSNDQTKRNKASKNTVRDILKALVFLLGVMFCFFVGIILFGAPVLDCHEETLMLSGLLTLLAVFPLVAHAGMESSMQLLFRVKKFPKDSVMSMLVYNATMAVIGAWVGAVVIPLDWNTPWQKWPIPCYLGAIGGYLLANVYNVLSIPLMSAVNKYPALNYFVSVFNKFDVTK
ncbi:phosphatidylinositol-glycan biosynthesis class F protein [Epargyreus clarus]|uniref:phosphatidylinositol-glycan biosynthesis class F protein n=1 Tax=Epargyreus clarus TaxID=520877 RepID=UPI003C2CB748